MRTTNGETPVFSKDSKKPTVFIAFIPNSGHGGTLQASSIPIMSSRRLLTALWRQHASMRGFPVDSVCGVAPARALAAAELSGRGVPANCAWRGDFIARRAMSTAPADKDGSAGKEGAHVAGESATEHDPGLLEELQGMSTEELHEHIVQIKKDLEEKEASIAEMKDRLVRTLADMENLRERTGKQLAEARKFATQGLVKSLVDVADNLERAAASVVKDVDAAELDVEKALNLLHGLKDGVVMTDGILMKILEKEGVKRYDPSGESFDPNLHEALFEVPASGDAKPGTVAVVVKKGYLMHDRAVRAAEVGVVKDE